MAFYISDGFLTYIYEEFSLMLTYLFQNLNEPHSEQRREKQFFPAEILGHFHLFQKIFFVVLYSCELQQHQLDGNF